MFLWGVISSYYICRILREKMLSNRYHHDYSGWLLKERPAFGPLEITAVLAGKKCFQEVTHFFSFTYGIMKLAFAHGYVGKISALTLVMKKFGNQHQIHILS